MPYALRLWRFILARIKSRAGQTVIVDLITWGGRIPVTGYLHRFRAWDKQSAILAGMLIMQVVGFFLERRFPFKDTTRSKKIGYIYHLSWSMLQIGFIFYMTRSFMLIPIFERHYLIATTIGSLITVAVSYYARGYVHGTNGKKG